MVAAAAVYLFLIAPAFARALSEPFGALITEQAALPAMQVSLLLLFLYFLFFPISLMARDARTSQIEIFLASPIRPSDLVLGRFLGVMPFYGLAVVLIAGTFLAFLDQVGIGPVQFGMMTMVFVIVFLSALWIGTVTAGVLRARIESLAGGRDLAKALAMLLVLPLLGLTYFLIGTSTDELASIADHPLIGPVLAMMPSSWGAELFVAYYRTPGDLAAVAGDTLLYMGGLVTFLLASLILGVWVIDRAYSMESTSYSSPQVRRDGWFMRHMKAMGPGGFGIVVASIMKDYMRRYENLSKLAYTLGLLVIVLILLLDSSDPRGMVLMMMMFLPLMAAFTVGEVTLRGKEALFIYRKTPMGEWRFIFARLIQTWLVLVPIVMVSVPTLLLLTGLRPYATVAWLTVSLTLVMMVTAMISLGIFLRFPAFTDRSAELMANIMVVSLTVLILHIVGIEVLGIYDLVLTVAWVLPFLSLLALVALLTGRHHLSRIE